MGEASRSALNRRTTTPLGRRNEQHATSISAASCREETPVGPTISGGCRELSLPPFRHFAAATPPHLRAKARRRQRSTASAGYRTIDVHRLPRSTEVRTLEGSRANCLPQGNTTGLRSSYCSRCCGCSAGAAAEVADGAWFRPHRSAPTLTAPPSKLLYRSYSSPPKQRRSPSSRRKGTIVLQMVPFGHRHLKAELLSFWAPPPPV